MRVFVRKVGGRVWYPSVATSIKSWHSLRVQPESVVSKQIERKLFNGAWVGSRRKGKGQLREEFTDVWLATETHLLGHDTSMCFARVEGLTHTLCVVLCTMGYSAEIIHDDSTYVCHLNKKDTTTQGVTRLGVRITNLLVGDGKKAHEISLGKVPALPKFDGTPRLVKK